MKSKLLGETPLLLPAVCMVAGIIIGEYVSTELPLLPLFIGCVAVALLLWKYELLQSVAIAVCLVMLGLLLMHRQKAAMRVEWPQGEVVCEAVVASEPVEKPKTMAVDILLVNNSRKLKCYLYKDDRSRALRIGDGLRIQSRINPNPDWHRGTFDYRRYLDTHGFSGNTFVPGWKWQKAQVPLSDLSRLERMRLRFLKYRSQLLARIRSAAVADGKPVSSLSDAYSVVAAMTLGDKSALTRELKDIYSVTGASHVLALSGLHLGILYFLLSLFFGGNRFSTLYSLLFTLLSIWAFVFLVGMPVSVVRAAVMLTVYTLLSLGHRDKMSVNTLVFTAMLMLAVNPLSLFDVGFQMSYLSVLGILVFVPLFDSMVSGEWLMEHRVVRWLWGMLAVSCAAQIGVAPLTAYYFGRFAAFFFLTNFIVIPATVIILCLSLVVLALPSLAYILLYVVSLLNGALEWVAAFPGASIEGLHPTILQTAMIYVIIAAVYLLIVRLRR